MSLGIVVNRKKNGALLAYIAKNIPNVSLRKLLKIVYLIDEKFMELRGFPLTWFDYYAWEKGPVAPEVYEVKNGAFSEYVTCHKNEEGTNIIDAALPHRYHALRQMDLFSQYEMGIIDQIVFRHENTTADELSALTHREDTLWSRIVREKEVNFVDGKSDVQIPLKMLNEGNAEKEETYEEALEYMQFCKAQ
ncbi:MAG: SocA family protein [Prevotella sp.]|nr:SocA family protein [Prevotella sp.]